MKRPFAYITAAWGGNEIENTEQAAKYCRAVYDAGFAPVCPLLSLPLYLNNAIPQEHKAGIGIGHELLPHSHVLMACGCAVDEAMKNDITAVEKFAIIVTAYIIATTIEESMVLKSKLW